MEAMAYCQCQRCRGGEMKCGGNTPAWGHCGYGVWRAMNRLRSGVGRVGLDMMRWGFGGCDRCECGVLQTRDHFLVCRHNPVECSQKDLVNATLRALAMAQYWSGRTIRVNRDD